MFHHLQCKRKSLKKGHDLSHCPTLYSLELAPNPAKHLDLHQTIPSSSMAVLSAMDQPTMKLITADASPFGRKCKIAVHELAMTARVNIGSPGAVTPVSINADVNSINPLGMIPVLELPGGESLFDSPVIAEYLNTVANGNLYPGPTTERFRALKLQALADGIMDISVATRYETALRPESLRWPEWIEHQSLAVGRGLATLNELVPTFSTSLTIGEIAVACALGYRDFRFSDQPWREDNPALATWFEQASQWQSFHATLPS